MSTQIDDRMEFYLMTTSKSTWNGLFSNDTLLRTHHRDKKYIPGWLSFVLGRHIGIIIFLLGNSSHKDGLLGFDDMFLFR
jgi:hypothetical protein